MDSELKRAVAVVGELPSIPAIASKVMTIANNANASAEDLRKIIEQDPTLAARVLKVANSSLYGFGRQIETLRHAVTLLGFRTVECLVMAASLRDTFKHFGLAEKLMWEHSTYTGVVEGKLATHPKIKVDREAAFTAGLLHDLGKIALSNVFRERYQKVVARAYNEGCPAIEAETDEFGFDHAMLGALVAEKWNLPGTLVSAIRYHHAHPNEYPQTVPEHHRLIALTAVATRACTRLGLGRRAAVESIDLAALPAWAALGLGADDVEPVLEIVTNEAQLAKGLFG
jgi:putative nucleotidyltransferase with HDIG domain